MHRTQTPQTESPSTKRLLHDDPHSHTWDRNLFASTPEDLEIAEAIRAVERVAESSHIKGSTRVSLRLALQALRNDRS